SKTNLMIFLRPKIMRDANQAAYETELKYNYMQDQQKPIFHLIPSDIPPLLPGTPPGKLPPLPPPPPPREAPRRCRPRHHRVPTAPPASPRPMLRARRNRRRSPSCLRPGGC